jgi:two-component sensor histidine kinase
VIQVVDEEVGRFGTTDLMLLESLASAAAIAIENARLYEEAKGLHRQAQEYAETKAMLLREVNHRVGNNLTAMLGLLSAERDHAKETGQSAYQSIMEELTSRVQGLVTVHRMLSASQWMPLQLSDLASQVIHSSLQMLPFDKYVSVDVTPSPVRVPPDQAHNLALVINELATNSVKYALRGRDTAHVAVHIALEGDGDTVRFEFRDDGPGYPDEVLRLERHSIGMELVETIVCHTLGGELALRNDPGAVTLIRFKASARENSK